MMVILKAIVDLNDDDSNVCDSEYNNNNEFDLY